MNNPSTQVCTHRQLLALLLFFVSVHGWSLLSHSVAWDGFTYYELLKAGDLRTIAANHLEGGIPQGIVPYAIISVFPDKILGGKLLSLLCELIASLVFLYLLMRHRALDRNAALFAAALFSLHSNVLVYIGLGMINYEFGLALFALGMLLYIRAQDARSRTARIALLGSSALLFFNSFFIASLLVFYLLFVLSAYHLRFGSLGIDRQRVITFVKTTWFFLILPPIAFAARPAAHGGYEGENHIALSRLWVTGYFDSLITNVLPTLALPFRYLAEEPSLIIALMSFWLVSWLLLRWAWSHSPETDRPFVHAPWLALFLFVAGVFPFLAVGKVPGFKDWGSRYAMLLPVAQSLFIAALLTRATRRTRALVVQGIYALMLALFATATLETYRRWDVDWFKQVAVIDQLKTMTEVRNAATIYVDDQTPQFDALERKYRFYEYNAWFLEAYGDERRLGVPVHSQAAQVARDTERRTFLMSGYGPSDPKVLLLVGNGGLNPLSLPLYLRLKNAELSGHDPHWANGVVTLRTQSLSHSAESDPAH